MNAKKTIRDIDVTGKKVLVRVDFNVPVKDGVVGDDTRIRAALPTIQYLLDKGAAVILCSHFGRPKGSPDPKYTLKPVADYLGKLMNLPVKFIEDCIGPNVQFAADNLKNGEVLLLENTRFHEEETNNDPGMSKQLASLAEIYVNDAFGSAHRAHASTEGVAKFLPAVAGFLMEKEIQYLGQAIQNPERPFTAILGGAKVSDKIEVIRNLLNKSDQILIGGGMANTFHKAQGFPVGDSLVEDDVIDLAKDLLRSSGDKLKLPIDFVIADKFDADAQSKMIPAGPIPDGWRVLDIGEKTVKYFGDILQNSKTIVWNGPMGVFEFEKFAKGTLGIAKAVADSKAVSIVGGGESVAAINQFGLDDQITHISTGGGASLEMLEGKVLPGLAALMDK